MRIIGFNFKKINAERKKDLKGKIEVKTHIDIEKIEKETLDIAGDILRFSFLYSISYDPDHAKLSFEGTILAKPDQGEDVAKLIKEHNKKKHLPEDITLMIFNFIIGKCTLKALQLEEEFNIPPHIPIPKFSKPQEGKTNYTG